MHSKKSDKVRDKMHEGLVVSHLDNGQIEVELHYTDVSARGETLEEAFTKLAEEAAKIFGSDRWYGHCSKCDTPYTLTHTGMYRCDCGVFYSPE